MIVLNFQEVGEQDERFAFACCTPAKSRVLPKNSSKIAYKEMI